MSVRLAAIVSHPIQHFAPWHREVTAGGEVDLRVFFCCDWGVEDFVDPDFETSFKWDVPLTEGYAHEFLPIARRPRQLGFLEVDNPGIGPALDRFDPEVVQVFGYAYRTNWRAVAWARRKRRPVLLYSDSNVKAEPSGWKRFAKDRVVRHFYRRVDGALYVGDNNQAYHRLYGIPEERLFLGCYPIDRERLMAAVPDREAARRRIREQHGIPEDAFVVLFCGKYLPRKRPLDLVRAVLGAAGKDVPAWAVLVGEGPLRGEIEGFVREQGASSVVLTGFVNQKTIPEYYAASDALSVPSDFDAHPLVVSEGASFGLPVLASDAIGCVGPNDTARPDVNTLVLPCADVRALEEGIVSLHRDTALYERLSSGSTRISKDQDARVAAGSLAAAAHALRRLGPRSPR